MTTARSTQIDLSATPYYHCITRCVRRSFLCGKDLETGKDYSYRKEWIVARMKQLASIFAINVCAYAVMSNHYHLVLFIDENAAKGWNSEEIVARWSKIFPDDAKKSNNSLFSNKEVSAKLELWRERLMSISWFMRCLNETIARISNQEDDCRGRFWEGRFKSQALLDEGALLSAMAYVDLNPIRAKIANTPEGSEFTSIQERIQAVAKQLKKNSSQDEIAKYCDNAKQPQQLMAFANGKQGNKQTIDFNLSDYLQLIDSTGRILREDKPGAVPDNLAPILSRLNLNPKGWLTMVKNLEQSFFLAVGDSITLINFGSQFRKCNPKGIRAAKACYKTAA